MSSRWTEIAGLRRPYRSGGAADDVDGRGMVVRQIELTKEQIEWWQSTQAEIAGAIGWRPSFAGLVRGFIETARQDDRVIVEAMRHGFPSLDDQPLANRSRPRLIEERRPAPDDEVEE